jgi:selenocysteine lyase/cysteine desulfurase
MPLTPQHVERLRAETPGCAERIHLDNAGAGLMPRVVSDAIKSHIDLEGNIGGYEAADACREAIRSSYTAVADLIGCQSRNVAFVENATVGYAQALSAIPFEKGDTVLTSTSDYISNQIMFLSLARRMGVEILRVPNAPEGGVDIEAMCATIRNDRPRLVALTHVPTNSGLVQPVADIGRVCRENDVLYLVDACQSVGQLPIGVHEIGCDFLSATSRKFLRGPRGSGFLFVADRVLKMGLEPLFIDMQGAEWREADSYVPFDTAARFENWEFAYALVLGSGAAARYATAVGVSDIAARTSSLADLLRQELGNADLRVLDRGPELCGIVTVEIPGLDATAFHDALQHRGVNSSVSIRAYGVIDFDEQDVAWALRLSPHYYNTEQEIEAAVAAVCEVAGASA